MVHAVCLDLEALGHDAQQVGRRVALHPDVGVMQQRRHGLANEEEAHVVKLLCRHPPALDLIDVVVAKVGDERAVQALEDVVNRDGTGVLAVLVQHWARQNLVALQQRHRRAHRCCLLDRCERVLVRRDEVRRRGRRRRRRSTRVATHRSAPRSALKQQLRERRRWRDGRQRDAAQQLRGRPLHLGAAHHLLHRHARHAVGNRHVLVHRQQQQAVVGKRQRADVGCRQVANELAVGVDDAHGRLVVNRHVVKRNHCGCVVRHRQTRPVREIQLLERGVGREAQLVAVLPQQLHHIDLGHDIGRAPRRRGLTLRARLVVDDGRAALLRDVLLRGFVGVAHVDAVVHLRAADLEALGHDAQQVGRRVALHPDVSVMQQRGHRLANEEEAHVVELLSRHPPALNLVDVAITQVGHQACSVACVENQQAEVCTPT
eukprot:353082-Chlamydomonas_euryale.AAC.17